VKSRFTRSGTGVRGRPCAPAAATRDTRVDITYGPTYEGWLFLAAVMDIYSGKIRLEACATTSRHR
jgi:hypothetical protein